MTAGPTGTAAAPAGTSAQPGVQTGPVNPALGGPTGGIGNENIGTQALNPNNGPVPAMSGQTNQPVQQVLPGQPNLVNNGVAIGGYPYGGYVVGTPTVDIGGNVAPSPVGASNATPGLQAGATNSTLLQGGVPAGSVMSQSAYTYNPGAVAVPINASGGAPSAASSAPNAGAYYAGPIFNTGAAQFGGVQTGASGQSLAQVAREYRQKKGTQNARVYTNQDLERLAQQPTTGMAANGVSAQGASGQMQGAGAAQPESGCNVGGTAGAASNCAATQSAQPAPGSVAAPMNSGVISAPQPSIATPAQQPASPQPPQPESPK